MRKLILIALFFLPSTVWAIPEVQEMTLQNGLRVLLMEAHNVPMVTMALSIPSGSRFDPAGKGGTSSLMASMLSDHTAGLNADEWADYLDKEAIQLSSGTNRDTLTIRVNVLSEVIAEGVQALSMTAFDPGWRENRFELLKQDSIAAATKALEDPGVLGRNALLKAVYGDHPYGHSPGGSPESLAKITLEDMDILYHKQFRPQGSILAVSGDITMQNLLDVLGTLMRLWQGRPDQAISAKIPRPAKQFMNFWETTDTTQAHVLFGRLGPARYDENFMAMLILNHLLGGGGFGSLLMDEVREKRGLAYGAYSYFQALANPGPYIISLQTRADQASEAIDVVRDVLDDLHDDGMSTAQLVKTKNNLVGSFALKVDSNADRVGLLTMIGMYDLPLDYMHTWTDRINNVTLKEVNQAARDYLSPYKWTLVLVGPAPSQ